jgi:16S rRNA (guanine(1405)-N(7))-methyltransferase
MAASEDALDEVVRSVAASPLYRGIAPELIASVGRRELGKRRSLKEAVKATKSKLHQVAGAYFPRQDYAGWLSMLERAAAGGPDDLKAACRAILGQHASTRERLPILDELYARTLGTIPPPRRVLDLACGLHPLAIPWMPLAPDAEYVAYDVFPDLATFLNRVLPLLGVRGTAQVADVTAAPPTGHADLALLLKALPCLEQLDAAAGARLLDALDADHVLVTFPVHSLGGRRKGMVATYDARMERLLAGKRWSVARFEFATELAFLLAQ